jgi:hypothetical protein
MSSVGSQLIHKRHSALSPLAILNILGPSADVLLSAVLYTILELVYLRLYPLHLFFDR